MKRSVLTLLFILTGLQSYCITDTTHIHPFFLNTFSTSINTVTGKDENANNNYGYGFGIYHFARTNKPTTFIFGFEFNKTYQFQSYGPADSHFSDASNVTYSIYDFSVNLGLKINVLRRKQTLFIDPGISLDLISASGIGTVNDYEPTHSDTTYIGPVNGGSAAVLGLHIGIGILVPVSKFKLIIEPDYKLELGSIEYYDLILYNNYFRLMVQLKYL